MQVFRYNIPTASTELVQILVVFENLMTKETVYRKYKIFRNQPFWEVGKIISFPEEGWEGKVLKIYNQTIDFEFNYSP